MLSFKAGIGPAQRCAAAASRVSDAPWDPVVAAPAARNVTVALAAGKAFTFGYTEHAELLRAAPAARRWSAARYWMSLGCSM